MFSCLDNKAIIYKALVPKWWYVSSFDNFLETLWILSKFWKDCLIWSNNIDYPNNVDQNVYLKQSLTLTAVRFQDNHVYLAIKSFSIEIYMHI